MMLVPDALNLGTQRVIALEKRGRGLDGDQWKASTSFGILKLKFRSDDAAAEAEHE